MAKVLVVEDGDIGRLGRTVALEAAGHEVTAFAWRDLGAGSSGAVQATPHDVMVAVLSPDRTGWDRYPVLPALSSLVHRPGSSMTAIGLLEGDAVDNAVLALRLANAGIERVTDVALVRTLDDMNRVVTDESATATVHPSDVELLQAGVVPGSDPDAVVAWVEERLAGPLGDHYRKAFDPGFTQAACGLTRRQAYTMRTRLSALGRIRPNPNHSGGGPMRDWSLPRWSEVVSVVNLCRGFEPDRARRAGQVVGDQVESRRAA